MKTQRRVPGNRQNRLHRYGQTAEYDPDYLAGGAPISFTLPLQEAAFNFERLPAFFENLASEGWLRKLQSQEQKIDENDRFGLLLMNGRDLVGAVTLVPLQA